jgi:hypothetical protein
MDSKPVSLRSPQDHLAQRTRSAHEVLHASRQRNYSDAECIVAFADAAARYVETEETHASRKARPSTADFRADFELAARAALSAELWFVFKACFIRGVLRKDRIPAHHLTSIEVRVGKELLRRGVVSNESLNDYLFTSSLVLAERCEEQQKLKRKADFKERHQKRKGKDVTADGRKKRIEPNQMDEQGLRRLWANVLFKTMADIRNADPKKFKLALDALDWIFSERSQLCFAALGMDGDRFRESVKTTDAARIAEIVAEYRAQIGSEQEQRKAA